MADRAKADKTDLNAAGRDELVAIPGIGPAAADAIIDHRKRHGRFGSLDELAAVPGVGGATLEHVRGRLAVSPAEGGRRGGQRHGGEAADRGAELSRRAGRAAADGYAELFALTRDNVEGLARASEVVFGRTSELNRVWLSFWRARDGRPARLPDAGERAVLEATMSA